MFYKKIFLPILTVIILLSCNNELVKDDNIVAEVSGKILTKTEIKNSTPKNINSEDSTLYVKDYIKKWIKKELLIKKAKLNLSSEITEIDKQVEDYKNSLLIFNYQQQLLNDKLDTTISDKEISEYYQRTIGEYKLDFNILKAVYFKIPKSVKKLTPFKTWYWSNKDKYIADLEVLCEEKKGEYSSADKWISFDEFQKIIPKKIDNESNFLMYTNAIYGEDSLFNYFVRIKDHKLLNDTTPLIFVKNKVSAIIINNRKMDFLRDMENNIFENSKNEITIY